MRRREFFERVPDLFQRANRRLWEPYEEALFAIRRPFTHGNYWAVRRYCGGNPPQPALNDHRAFRELDQILSRAKYPDAGTLERLHDFTEGRVEFASALLHFHNPAYPIFDEATVRGLNQMGTTHHFTAGFAEETVQRYQAYIDEIQDLKDAIPYYDVPERNYYLTRIVQESLWQLGMEKPVPAAQRKTPSRTASH